MEEEVDMSVLDMKEEVQSMKEKIRLLKEQRRSPWAEGLSDDPPPGYTPMEMRTRNSRDVLI
ncbi:hypothetical protein K443DRAFT_113112 [Laccaria amethystina LaAM-08-1]|uniref:Unplaced genomic scaffold K443scaffold_352, whole genome shotgun sequence n=1 Tax=Laccaria amethystina LaAM-08-1 TaxID=1095629 RepID=A0A0C9X8R7_9AGAR|nr:hypothetical protein K443DRAFT_113112 [Laccaria amethystina LaAM-08-1]